MTYIVAVAGMIGSGKTTLAKQLSRVLGWRFVPESLPATAYLEDLFVDPNRWAFEAQTAFLVLKAAQALEELRSGRNVVLDRSLSEDRNVFAKHFYDNGNIDFRSIELYNSIANLLQPTSTTPHIIIYCECPLQVCIKRIIARSSNLTSLHTQEYLTSIYKYYQEWLKTASDQTLCVLDTHKYDTRDVNVVKQVAYQIDELLQTILSPPEQLSLFDNASPNQENNALPMQVIHTAPTQSSLTNNRSNKRKLAYPAIYFAAPFTSQAINSSHDDSALLAVSRIHGVIPRGEYRQQLLAICRVLEGQDYSVFLPHRDVNGWGRKAVAPGEVAKRCTDAVTEADLFVGILGNSQGAHLEYGLARGLNKPTVMFRCRGMSESYIASGIEHLGGDQLVMLCDHISEIPGLLHEDVVRSFMQSKIT